MRDPEPEPLDLWTGVLVIGIREDDPERVRRARLMLARHCGILIEPHEALGPTDPDVEGVLVDLARIHHTNQLVTAREAGDEAAAARARRHLEALGVSVNGRLRRKS